MELAFETLAGAFGFTVRKLDDANGWMKAACASGKLIGVWKDGTFAVLGSPMAQEAALKKWQDELVSEGDRTPLPFIDSSWLALSLFSEGDLDALVCGSECIEFPVMAREISLAIAQAAQDAANPHQSGKIAKLKGFDDALKNPFVSNLWGKLLAFEKNYSDAGTAFRAAATILPDFGEPYSNLGTLLWGHGQKKEGFFLFTEAMLRNPYTTPAQLNFFDSGYELKEYGVMAKVIEELLPRVAHIPELKHHLAICYHKTGRLSQASSILRQLLADHPGDAEATQLLNEFEEQGAQAHA